MTDQLTEEELAVMAADAPSFATADNLRCLIADLRASRAEVERLREALIDATDEMEDMIGYIPAHIRKKWQYDEAIAQARGEVR